MEMTFVMVPAGTFLMGSPEDEPFRNKDEVLHKVTLTKPFYIQTTEVTEAQWHSVMGRKWFGRRGGGNLPVVKVSWYDCMEFVEKLNRLGEGRYRLPTEAEWEYACRAGSQAPYAWGKTMDCTQAMFGNNSSDSRDCLDYARKRDLPMDGPAPVKSYPPNAWGLYRHARQCVGVVPGRVWRLSPRQCYGPKRDTLRLSEDSSRWELVQRGVPLPFSQPQFWSPCQPLYDPGLPRGEGGE